jgi:hypothetical protein
VNSAEEDQHIRDRAIGEAYTIKIRLGFLITSVVALISVIAIFISLRNDVVALLNTVSTQQKIIVSIQNDNIELRIQIQSIHDNLAYLKETIESEHKYAYRKER